MTEHMYTARVHRPDGVTERLTIETQGGKPVPQIEITGRENALQISHRVYNLAPDQADAADEFDYYLA